MVSTLRLLFACSKVKHYMTFTVCISTSYGREAWTRQGYLKYGRPSTHHDPVNQTMGRGRDSLDGGPGS